MDYLGQSKEELRSKCNGYAFRHYGTAFSQGVKNKTKVAHMRSAHFKGQCLLSED